MIANTINKEVTRECDQSSPVRLNDQDSICISDYSDLLDLRYSHYYSIYRPVPVATHTCCCALQSDAIVETSAPTSTSTENQVTVGFSDEVGGDYAGWTGSGMGLSNMDQTSGVGLNSYLSRPVRIGGFTWSEGDAVGTQRSYRPWQLFFNDPAIKNKLANYAFLQCDLHVKVLINASPFYAGRMICAYQPVPGFTPTTIQRPVGSGEKWLIPLSQRPNIMLKATTSEGGTMVLPWFYHKNWLNISSDTDLYELGILDFVNYTTLRSANGVTGTGVSVQIFAWAENVKLSGPTCGLPLQGGDEYGNGVVSGPASAVASAASWFENIPIIGTFATATRIGASAVSAIASLFGWTNVPVLDDTKPYRPSAFPQLASTSIGYPAEKLTVDPKNELSVDPRIMGLDGKDELVIKNIVTRESYLTTVNWTSALNVDDILFTSTVNPVLQDVHTTPENHKAVYMLPMAWLCPLFKHWRGDIIFRFVFDATPYHKGRVRISYDPAGTAANNLTNTVNSYSAVKTHIVDLGEEQDIELRIPYQQATSYQQIQNSYSVKNWTASATPAFNRNATFDNGMIMLRVQTELTSPVAAATVPILIFARAAENFELANPNNIEPTISTFEPQCDSLTESETKEVLGTGYEHVNPDRNLVHFGEVTPTLRSILRRFTLSHVFVPSTGNNNEVHFIIRNRISRFPMPFGWDPNGLNTANKTLSAGTANFTYSHVHPYNYISPAYVAQRGSMQLTVNVDATEPCNHVRILRTPNKGGANSSISYSQQAVGTGSSASRFYVNNTDNGSAGQALTNQHTCTGLTVQLPNYTQFKFHSTYPGGIVTNPEYSASDIDGHMIETSWTAAPNGTANPSTSYIFSKQWRYYAIGTDFNLHWFLNVPTYWNYASLPTTP